MTVYIRNFHFVESFGKQKINFEYFTGYRWKRLSVDNQFGAENVAVYTRFVLDRIVDDLCGGEKDIAVRNTIIKEFEAKQMCMVQLNSGEFKEATKIFS